MDVNSKYDVISNLKSLDKKLDLFDAKGKQDYLTVTYDLRGTLSQGR